MEKKEWLPEILILGPGGYKGFLELGALLYLNKINFLKNVHTYVGVSVGAVIGLLLVSGYTIPEIISESLDTTLFMDVSHLNFEDVKNNSGLISNTHIKNKLQILLTRKFGFVPSLDQLYMATGLNLVTVSMNIDKGEPTYFSRLSEPNISCVDATLLSMNIPIIFYQIKYKNNVYIDGAFGNPYPIDQYDNGKTPILGIYIETEDTSNTPISYLFKILNSSIHQIKNRIIKDASPQCKHLVLKSNVIDITGASLSIKCKEDMIISGNKIAEQFIKILHDGIEEDKEYIIILGGEEPTNNTITYIPILNRINDTSLHFDHI